jgi:hypothetical protein
MLMLTMLSGEYPGLKKSPILVNPAHITWVTTRDKQTMIHLVNNEVLTIEESQEELASLQKKQEELKALVHSYVVWRVSPDNNGNHHDVPDVFFRKLEQLVLGE